MCGQHYPIYRPSIERWVDSVADNTANVEEPRAKRPKVRQKNDLQVKDEDFELPFDMPFDMPPPLPPPPLVSPAPTGSDPLSDTRKRGRDTEVDSLHRTLEPSRSLPKRLARTSKLVKSRDLAGLEKPIMLAGSNNLTDLSADVKALHRQIHIINNFKHGIFPAEVRSQIEGMVDLPILPASYRKPDPTNCLDAASTFYTLRAIVQAAALSQTFNRHEDAWNHMVHTPLLHLAFPPPNFTAQGTVNEIENVSVRFEPIMSATMLYQWIPRLNRGSVSDQVKKITQLSDVACSVDLSPSCLSETSDGNNHGSDRATVPKTLIHTPCGSKKVDYVLTLDIPDGTPLKAVIINLLQAELIRAVDAGISSPFPYFNQTNYGPLRESPIAVSIETKNDGSARDPIIQLGIWTAAWHRRMIALYKARAFQVLDKQFYMRQALEDQPCDGVAPGSPGLRLVSLPLIVATAHDWKIYYACDRETFIELYGPFSIGSTGTIMEAYALLASLKAIENWIQTTFFAAMKSWFQCNE